MEVRTTVLEFVDAINEADVGRLGALMTEDHAFMDSDGSRVVGRASVLDAWSQYFSMVGDYRVPAAETYVAAGTVVLLGCAEGRCGGSRGAAGPGCRSVPAAWRAVGKGERVAIWQVFVNPGPILAAMRGASR